VLIHLPKPICFLAVIVRLAVADAELHCTLFFKLVVQKLPRVDVGSLEEVIVKMEGDKKGEWGDVMFVPAGSLVGPQQADKAE